MTQPVLLFVLNGEGLRLEEGCPPYSPLSENSHAFVLAHEALRLGWGVYFQIKESLNCIEIGAVYPNLKIGKVRILLEDSFRPDWLFFINYPLDMAPYRQKGCGVIYVLNAHFWLEAPEVHGIAMPEFWREVLANDVDYIFTQNPRMAELGYCLFNIIAKWPSRERFLIAPNTFAPEVQAAEAKRFDRASIRNLMGASNNDIVIINSGGAWSWTDTPTFLTAFAQAHTRGAKHLKFIQMGFRQAINTFQEASENALRFFITQHFDLIEQGRVTIIDDWAEASKLLPEWNYGADIGLCVSVDSPESYQSHRVRFIDYAKAGLPVLQTIGSYYGDRSAANAVIPVVSGDIESYVQVLLALDRGEIDLSAKAHAMQIFREQIASDRVLPGPLLQIIQQGRMPVAERMAYKQSLRQFYEGTAHQNFSHRFA